MTWQLFVLFICIMILLFQLEILNPYDPIWQFQSEASTRQASQETQDKEKKNLRDIRALSYHSPSEEDRTNETFSFWLLIPLAIQTVNMSSRLQAN